jgi:hypothetical protein
VAPRLEQKRVQPVALRPAKLARRRFSPGILPGGVRTFLSELLNGRGVTRALGSKNSERQSGSETKRDTVGECRVGCKLGVLVADGNDEGRAAGAAGAAE